MVSRLSSHVASTVALQNQVGLLNVDGRIFRNLAILFVDKLIESPKPLLTPEETKVEENRRAEP